MGGGLPKRAQVNTATPPSSGEGTSLSAPQAVVRELQKGPPPEPREGLARLPKSPAPGSHSARATPKFRHAAAPDPAAGVSLPPATSPPRAGKVRPRPRAPSPALTPRGADRSARRAEKGGRRRERGAPHSGPCGPGLRPSWKPGGGCWDVTCRRPTPLRGAPPARGPQPPPPPPGTRQGRVGGAAARPAGSGREGRTLGRPPPPGRAATPGAPSVARDVGLTAGGLGDRF